jgi:O-antigen/teichoic acid export membrane protein
MPVPIVSATVLGLAAVVLAVLTLQSYRRDTLEALQWSYEGSKWTFLMLLLAFAVLASAHALGTYVIFLVLDVLTLVGWYASARAIRARRDAAWSARTDEIKKALFGQRLAD